MAAGEKLHTLSLVLQVTWLLSLIGMVTVLQQQADTVVLVKFQACVSKITVELTLFLPCILKQNITEGVTDVLWLVTSFAAALL